MIGTSQTGATRHPPAVSGPHLKKYPHGGALLLTPCLVSECVTGALLRNNGCKHPLSVAMHHLLYN